MTRDLYDSWRAHDVCVCPFDHRPAGASDNLSADASTFMVEMAEAACFLKDATADRFVKHKHCTRNHAQTRSVLSSSTSWAGALVPWKAPP